jgi:hypothetical protein
MPSWASESLLVCKLGHRKLVGCMLTPAGSPLYLTSWGVRCPCAGAWLAPHAATVAHPCLASWYSLNYLEVLTTPSSKTWSCASANSTRESAIRQPHFTPSTHTLMVSCHP